MFYNIILTEDANKVYISAQVQRRVATQVFKLTLYKTRFRLSIISVLAVVIVGFITG